MGQHFLTDPNIAKMIVRRGGFGPDDKVLEIGAGLGALTIPLAAQTRHVLAVEPDRQIAGILKNELSVAGISNVTVIEKDILKCNIQSLAEESHARLKVVGNLPYHISSQVLVQLIKVRRFVHGAVVMFQKEVAERLLAKPGSKTYGRLSVMIQYCGQIKPLAQVAATSFFPRPKVDSKVVDIAFEDPVHFPTADEYFLFQLVRAAFGKRRKTLKNALSNSDLGYEEAHISMALEMVNIDAQRRAETLSVKEFILLADCLKKNQGPSGGA